MRRARHLKEANATPFTPRYRHARLFTRAARRCRKPPQQHDSAPIHAFTVDADRRNAAAPLSPLRLRACRHAPHVVKMAPPAAMR